jgi:cleavage and polyadenylation specificity factor subunit 5
MTGKFAVPQNLKLVAVPFYDLYDNSQRYGAMIAAIPELFSRYQMAFM